VNDIAEDAAGFDFVNVGKGNGSLMAAHNNSVRLLLLANALLLTCFFMKSGSVDREK
jgi:hypothetical protein